MRDRRRCINLDWLEVYCLEDPAQPATPFMLKAQGLYVTEREYGTRVYKQMYVVLDKWGEPLIEVRRDPASQLGKTGVLPPNACHIRLVNRYCYSSNAVGILREFMQRVHLLFQRISRVDVCLDFERFDSGDDPQRFVQRYMKGRYAKINQSDLHAHGQDTWERRLFNSLSWGSLKSPIGTKLYNKTKELREVKDKPYIRQAWFDCYLIDDYNRMTKTQDDGKEYTPTIWRLEFSIRSDVKNWVRCETSDPKSPYQSYKNTLEMYDTPENLLVIFASLVHHYFHFKVYKYGRPKYESPDKTLFDFKTDESFFMVQHPSSQIPKYTKENRLSRYLREFLLSTTRDDLKDATLLILHYLDDHDHARMLPDYWNEKRVTLLQLLLTARMEHKPIDKEHLAAWIRGIAENGDFF